MRTWRLVGVIWAGALCGALLGYGGTVLAEEGVLLPLQTAPSATAVVPPRVQTGPSPWAVWAALAAQGATCATQEYGYATLGVYGAHKGARVRACALNVGPVLAVRVFGRWLRRADADVAVVPSIGWGVWGTAKNLHDIQRITAALRGAR